MSATKNISTSLEWMTQQAFPLWKTTGRTKDGSFREGIAFDGSPMNIPTRCLVQARQVYSFRIAKELECIPENEAQEVVGRATQRLLDQYILPSGAYRHSLDAAGGGNPKADLYTQAFVLFGLAHAYSLEPNPEWKARAESLLAYLQKERRGPHGGYTEIGSSGFAYQSNPHMHLFEAALSWMQVSEDNHWRDLAAELATLCMEKFIQPDSGLLCEHFDENWNPLRENGRFVCEPGHHFEWSWLMSIYQSLGGKDPNNYRLKLFTLGEKHGVCPQRKVAYDEIWSDLSPKKLSSRYWPQCERMKAALRLAQEYPEKSEALAASADEAWRTLFLFLDTPTPGLSFDFMDKTGKFGNEPPKASCLYHIVNALYEYVSIRPRL